LVNFGTTFFYYTKFLGVDDEEFGGTWELLKEGFMPSFGVFLVSWIISYNVIYIG